MKPKATKLALCLQVCPYDAIQAHRLLRIICAIEESIRYDIEFIIAARRGTPDIIVDTLAQEVRNKFANVFIIRGQRMGEGWPDGPNDLWAETMMRISIMVKDGKLQSSGVLTFEPDCVPLLANWIDLIAEEWAKAEDEGFKVLGHAHGEPEPDHINGNAVFSTRITKSHPELQGCPGNGGWDCMHGKLLLSIGKDTDLIYQVYRCPPVDENGLLAVKKNGQTPALFHGVKGFSALNIVEYKFLPAWIARRNLQQEQ